MGDLGLARVVGWIALLGLGLLGARPAVAAPSLILLEDNGGSNPVYRRVMESLGAVIVANNLGHQYDHIDVLTGARATREALFAQIRKRGAQSAVDVVILTHGEPKRLNLNTGDITDRDIRAAGVLPRLRLVYMMACYSASLEQAWRAAGAQTVVGHQDINSLPGFFFPRFLRRWSEGASARDAAQEAYRFAEGTASLLSDYIRQAQLLGAVGLERSAPVIDGVDLDLSGRTFPDHALAIAPLREDPSSGLGLGEWLKSAGVVESASSRYRHTDLERAGIELLGSMIPQATLNVDAIPSAQGLVDHVKGVAWEQLHDSFPNPGGDGVPGLGLPSEDGQEIWIDGDALRYFAAPLRQYGGERLSAVLDRVEGARLTRSGDLLNVGIYFSESFEIPLADAGQIANWRPYAVHLPKAVRFSARMTDGVLAVYGMDRGHDSLNFKVKMPALPDTVWLRSVTANLSDGKVHAEAGVIGDTVAVVANGELTARKFTGIDVWESIERNLDFLAFPSLSFQVYR